ASDRVLGRGDAGARRTTQALLDWLAAGREPFFAFVHYREALRPVRPPAPYDRAFMPAGLNAAQARNANPRVDGGARPLWAAGAAVGGALHGGPWSYAARPRKQVPEALAQDGRWEHPLFIVPASYGEDLGDDGTVDGPPALRDTTLRVPLVMRCPGRIPAGFVVQEFAQPVDGTPTVAGLTGCGFVAPGEGRAV